MGSNPSSEVSGFMTLSNFSASISSLVNWGNESPLSFRIITHNFKSQWPKVKNVSDSQRSLRHRMVEPRSELGLPECSSSAQMASHDPHCRHFSKC